jgi:hypothetical protein
MIARKRPGTVSPDWLACQEPKRAGGTGSVARSKRAGRVASAVFCSLIDSGLVRAA